MRKYTHDPASGNGTDMATQMLKEHHIKDIMERIWDKYAMAERELIPTIVEYVDSINLDLLDTEKNYFSVHPPMNYEDVRRVRREFGGKGGCNAVLNVTETGLDGWIEGWLEDARQMIMCNHPECKTTHCTKPGFCCRSSCREVNGSFTVFSRSDRMFYHKFHVPYFPLNATVFTSVIPDDKSPDPMIRYTVNSRQCSFFYIIVDVRDNQVINVKGRLNDAAAPLSEVTTDRTYPRRLEVREFVSRERLVVEDSHDCRLRAVLDLKNCIEED